MTIRNILAYLLLIFGISLSADFSDMHPQGQMQPVYDSIENTFHYPLKAAPRPKRSFFEKWSAWSSNEGRRIPDPPLTSEFVQMDKAFPAKGNGLYVTWLGHSSVVVQMQRAKILFDPVLTQEVSPVPWIRSIKRFQEHSPAKAADFPNLNLILLSHDHYDHMDKEALLALAHKTQMFVAPLGVGKRLIQWGIDSAKVRELTWWQKDSLQLKSGSYLYFVCTPARHFSGRSLWDRNSTLYASWVVYTDSARVFHSGDTGFGPHFAQIGHHYGPFDLTMIECGQYNTFWPQSHMFPEESVAAHLQLRGTSMLPIHWGAFSLSTHSWDEPMERVSRAAFLSQVNLLKPKVAQTLNVQKNN